MSLRAPILALLVPLAIVAACKSETAGEADGATDASTSDTAAPVDAGDGGAFDLQAKLGGPCASDVECGRAAGETGVGGAYCAQGRCCLGIATGECKKDEHCCGGKCIDGQCTCIPTGKPSPETSDGSSCCSRVAENGLCVAARPGGGCATNEDCALTKCNDRACEHLTAGQSCAFGSECISGSCATTCQCRKKDGEQACCADVGGDCGAIACCFGTCGRDGQCACATAGTACGAKEDCCSGKCVSGRCCGGGGEACASDAACCSGKCTAEQKCCVDSGRACTSASECCSGNCVDGVCCEPSGAGCKDRPCCGGLTCTLELDPLPKSICKK